MTGPAAGPFSFSRVFSGWWWLLQRDVGRLFPVLLIWAFVTFASLSADHALGFTSGLGLVSTTYLSDPFFSGICYWIALSDERTELNEAVQLSMRRYFALVALFVLASVGAGLGFLLLIIPGLALVVFWAVATPVLLSEELGPIAALRQSFHYTKKRFWPLLLLFAIYACLALAIVLVIFALGVASVDGEPGTGLAVESGAAVAVNIVSVCLTASIYRELLFTDDHDLSAFD